MNSNPCKCDIRRRAIELGAYRCGFARAEDVEPWAREAYARWIDDGRHGTMVYCAQHRDERDRPEGKSVIVCAYNYNSGPHPTGLIARYALGADYHWVVRDRLNRLAAYIKEAYGAESRVCVDTAPVRERYWAVRAGVGIIGVNNQLIIPGAGSYFFLGELITDLDLEPDTAIEGDCGRCMACVQVCPGQALDGRGGMDARRCLSYMTIESKDEPTPVKARCVYGCDICQQACPHNADAPLTDIAEFAPRPEILALTPDAIRDMGSAAYRRLVQGSVMRRVPLKKLKSNLSLLPDN